jgi:hypothetical protein
MESYYSVAIDVSIDVHAKNRKQGQRQMKVKLEI